VKNPARGGGRWLELPPERLVPWVDSFTERHNGVSITGTDYGVRLAAADGAVAECHVPFPPLPDEQPAPKSASQAAALIVSHANAARTVGVLLVRLGGYAAGVFAGAPPRLAASKVGSRLVHGRSAAGGTSQHRFARRREKQAAEAMSAAADNAARILHPYRAQLDAVVLGGDRRAIAALREDPRLARYFALATDRFLTVPDPRLTVLRDAPRLYLATRVRLTEPGQDVPPGPAGTG
jgi:hypothetical protein